MSKEELPMGQIQREASGFEFEIERRAEHTVRIREASGERYLDATMLEDGRMVTRNSGEFTPQMQAAAKRKAAAILRSWKQRSAPEVKKEEVAS